MTDFKLQILLTARDEISNATRKAGAAMKNLEARFKGVREAAQKVGEVGKGMLVAGAGITAAVGLGVNAFKELEDSKVSLQNVLGTVDGMDKHFDSLSKKAITLGNTLPGSTRDFYDLATALHRGGASAEDMDRGLLEAAANLKVVQRLGSDVAGEGLATTSMAFKLTGEESIKYADIINRTANSSRLKVADFFEAMKFIGAPAKQMGLSGLNSATQMSTLMGALANTGIDPSQVGTAFQEGVMRMSEAKTKLMAGRGAITKEAAAILGSKGISLDFFDKSGNTSVPQIIAQLEKLKVLTNEQRLKVGASIFGPQASRLALIGVSEFNTMAEKQAHAEALNSQIARETGTLSAKLKNFYGTASNAAATFFEPIAETMKVFLDRMNTLTGKLDTWAKANPRLASTIAGLGTGLGLIMVAIGGGAWVGSKLFLTFSNLLKAMVGAAKIVPGVISAFVKMSGAIWSATSAIVANTIANGKLYLEYLKLAGGPIKGLLSMMGDMGGVAGKLAKILSMDVGAALRGVWASIVGFIPAVWGAIAATWAWTVALLANPITWIIVGVVALGVAIWQLVKHWDGVKAALGKTWAWIKGAWDSVLGWFRAGFAWLHGLLKKTSDWVLLLTPFIGIPSLLVKQLGSIKAGLGSAWTWLKGAMGNMTEAGAKIVKTIAKGMVATISRPAEAIHSTAKKMRRFLPFSPAKEGPLQDIHRIKLVEAIAEDPRPGALLNRLKTVTMASRASAMALMAVGAPATAAHIQEAPRHVSGPMVGITFQIDSRGATRGVREEIEQTIKATIPALRIVVAQMIPPGGR